jgi:hypothetical protein
MVKEHLKFGQFEALVFTQNEHPRSQELRTRKHTLDVFGFSVDLSPKIHGYSMFHMSSLV